jgi:gliding motility-associated-like protein
MKKILRHTCFLLLCLLLLFSKALAQDAPPVLKAVSIDSLDSSLKISWLYDEIIDSVTVLKCTANCSGSDDLRRFDPVAKIVTTELEWIDKYAKSTEINYYRTCWSESRMSPTQNNMVLTTIPFLDGCPNSIGLSWNPYINMLDSLDFYNILYRKYQTPSQPFQWLASTEKNQYTAKFLANETVYDFVIQAVSKTDSVFAFSNTVTDSTKMVNTDPVEVIISSVSVVNDKEIKIDVHTGLFPAPENVKNVILVKGVEEAGSITFATVKTWEYNSNNEYYFTDAEVDPHSFLYNYQAIAEHHCKDNDTSTIISNILLTGNRLPDEKYQDEISFTQLGVTTFYHLLVNDKTIYNVDSPYIKDVEEFMNNGSDIKYTIVSVNTDAYSNEPWLSNTLVIPHEPSVDFPNAFYPNPNAREEDRTYYPIIRFPSEDDYQFYIYTRWGQLVFYAEKPPVFGEYHNTERCWDGKYQGQECPAGIYAYKLSYNYNNGKGKFSTTGSFMLVR